MLKKETIVPSKTYATEENADKAVRARFDLVANSETLRYFIARTADGRFFPVFVGVNAINYGVHFHFNVIG